MKCTNCGKKNAIYHFVSNLNGQVSETHLCEDCARAAKEERGEYPWESFDKLMDERMNSFFSDDPWMRSMLPSGLFDSRSRISDFFDNDLFGFPRMGAMMLPAFFFPVRREEHESAQESQSEGATQENTSEKKQGVDKGIARRREINALKEQMRRAAKNEDYEKAAQLRDQIKELENRAEG